MLLHAKHASHDHDGVVIRSLDMDIFVLAVGHKYSFHASLYFVTGTGNNCWIIDIIKIQEELMSDLSSALVGFHSFTGTVLIHCMYELDFFLYLLVGCDSTSVFHAKGKLKPFNLLEESPEFVNMFKNIGHADYQQELLGRSEKFVCQLYNQPNTTEVSKACLNLFRLRLQ